jgi:hypothetical protein
MAAAVAGKVRVAPRGTERRDVWWLEPLITVVVLGGFVVYSLWVVLNGQNYYSDPYLSPFYSPCFASNCPPGTFPLIPIGAISPAILIIWAPLAFRGTCYYYRKAYYRSFFWSPPACAVPDAARRYHGESRWPYLIQNIHRYAFWPALIVVVFLWIDAIKAFFFPGGIGLGLGTVILVVNAALLSLYSFSCHSCRHLAGGYLDVLSGRPVRYRMWRWISKMNEHHMLIAWCSLIFVAFTDVYVRLLATGIWHDVRFF